MDMIKIDEAYTQCMVAHGIMSREFIAQFTSVGKDENDELSIKLHNVVKALTEAADAFDALINGNSL